MALPNMAMIPSGYKPTKLYSVLPTETLGSEEVLNGDFSNGSTDWTLQTGWSVVSGYANCDNSGTGSRNLRQNSIVEVGKTYEVKFDLNVTSGTLYIIFGGTTGLTESKSYTLIRTSSGTDLQFRNSTGNFIGTIDNISVKEVLVGDADFDVTRATPATRVNQQGLIETPEFIESGDLVTNGDFSDGSTDWTLNNNASPSTNITNGALNIVTTTGFASVTQSNVMTVGKQYKVTVDVVATNGRQLALDTTSSVLLDTSTIGKKVVYFTTASTQLYIKRVNNNTDVTIDNISVVQVERNNIPRLDYTDGTCPVLLTEPQSTNLVPYSNDFSKWDVIQAALTSNYGLSPDGTKNSTRAIFSGSGQEVRDNITSSAITSGSLYVKGTSGETINFGLASAEALFTLNGNWQRFEKQGTSTSNRIGINTYSGATARDIQVWGAQVENLPFSTSIIPTNGSTVTRNKDIVNNAGTSATYNSVEGVLFAEMAALSQDANFQLGLFGTANAQLRFEFQGGTIRAQLYNGAYQASMSFATTLTDNHKIAFKYKENDFALWVDGVEVLTDTSGNTFSANELTKLNLTSSTGIAAVMEAKLSQVQVFNTALSDFDLQNLTSNATAYATYETMRTSLNFNIQ